MPLMTIRAKRLSNAIIRNTITAQEFDDLVSADGRDIEFADLFARPGQAAAVAASSTAMTAVAASPTAMAAVVDSPTAMAAVVDSPTAMAAVAASPTAMAAVVDSPTAMAAVAASPTAMTAVAASPTAMAAVVASSTAMTAVAASSTAKMAVFNSDTALNAIAASPTAMAACREASGYSVVSWAENGTNPVALTLTGTRHIVLGCSRGVAIARTITFTTLRSNTAISDTTPNTSGPASTTATDFDVAIPIVSPKTAKLNSTGTNTGYIGILRCDV